MVITSQVKKSRRRAARERKSTRRGKPQIVLRPLAAGAGWRMFNSAHVRLGVAVVRHVHKGDIRAHGA